MSGPAFMAMWHGLTNGSDAAFTRWHTREHMPDRVSLPGFARGRRYENPQHRMQPYFTLYEASTFDAFQSPEYSRRLQAPTSGTISAMRLFAHFTRCVCETLAHAGTGVGGAIATFRIGIDKGTTHTFGRAMGAFATTTAALDPVARVHVGLAHPNLMRSPAHPSGADAFNAVVLVEGTRMGELDRALPAIDRQLREAHSDTQVLEASVYDLAYVVSAEDVSGSTES